MCLQVFATCILLSVCAPWISLVSCCSWASLSFVMTSHMPRPGELECVAGCAAASVVQLPRSLLIDIRVLDVCTKQCCRHMSACRYHITCDHTRHAHHATISSPGGACVIHLSTSCLLAGICEHRVYAICRCMCCTAEAVQQHECVRCCYHVAYVTREPVCLYSASIVLGRACLARKSAAPTRFSASC